MNRAIDICIYSLKNSLSLKGRTNRREYWLFILMLVLPFNERLFLRE